MKVSPLIIEKLLNDKDFRLKTALALGVGEGNVRKLAKHNSDNLTKIAAINFFRSTGLSDKEIFAKGDFLNANSDDSESRIAV